MAKLVGGDGVGVWPAHALGVTLPCIVTGPYVVLCVAVAFPEVVWK
jgi:hypothetical protein